MKRLKLSFSPNLTVQERELCKRFWNAFDIDNYKDITTKAHLLALEYELEQASSVFKILSYCNVHDINQRCEICQRCRRIKYPYELKEMNTDEMIWRCNECWFMEI